MPLLGSGADTKHISTNSHADTIRREVLKRRQDNPKFVFILSDVRVLK